MTDGYARQQQSEAVGTRERPVLPTGALRRRMARLTKLNVSGLADELARRIVEELDYVREGRVQAEVAAAFTHRSAEGTRRSPRRGGT